MKTDKSGLVSAGILLWRRERGELEVLLAHMGGPFWVKKDHGHWTIPKGEIESGEEAEAVELREFTEETGRAPVPERRRGAGGAPGRGLHRSRHPCRVERHGVGAVVQALRRVSRLRHRRAF
jgi:ADP-ribose pyrophosphatase YjhB (NUDIX family)